MENVKKDEELKKHTSMRVGGKCKEFFSPTSIEELRQYIHDIRQNGLKFFILGNGTNVIFSDKGFDGCVISSQKLSFVEIERDIVCAFSGTNMFYLNRFLAQNCLMGLEWSYGIPGTIGGAVCMNAGAYGDEIGNFVEKVEILDEDELKIVGKEELKFSYRDSTIKQEKWIVTRVWLRLLPGDKDEIEKKQKLFYEKRKRSQPLEYPNSGSIFKKVGDESAGKIIDNLGLKGVKIGGAEVSRKHANFVVNKGLSTATDCIALIREIEDRVYRETGIKLEKEVIIEE